MFPVKIIVSIACMVLAGLFGLIAWRRSPGNSRLLVVQCFLAVFITIAARYWHPNGWLHNLYIPFDFGLVLYAAVGFLPSRLSFRYFLVAMLVYAAVWISLILINGFQQFCNWAYLTGCILLTITYLIVLFQVTLSGPQPQQKSITCLCFAILLYYAPAVPLFGMLNYLIGHDVVTAQKLYSNINWTLSNTRYLLIAIYFLFYVKRKTAISASLISSHLEH